MRTDVFRLDCCDRLVRTARFVDWIITNPKRLQQQYSDELILKHGNVFLYISHKFLVTLYLQHFNAGSYLSFKQLIVWSRAGVQHDNCTRYWRHIDHSYKISLN
jgi:hypothetical protein